MAPLARYPDFSDPAPVARRLPDTPTPVLIEPTHIVILRDEHGNRFVDQMTWGQTFSAVVRDLADGQIPLGCTLDSIRFDDGERVVTDVTAKVLKAVLTLCADRGEHISAATAPAFEHHGIELPAPFAEGAVAADILTPGRRAA